MARSKPQGKQKEAPLEDQDQQAGTMEKPQVKPSRDSDVSDDDSDKMDVDDNDSEEEEPLLEAADDDGADLPQKQ